MSTKKEDLLEQAEKLFYENGFHSIGLKRVVKEANVAVMTLYNHFASKEELILEVLKRREQQYFISLASGKKETSVVLQLAKAHGQWLLNHESRGCMFLRAKEEFGADDGHGIVSFVNEHKQKLINDFENQGLAEEQAIRLALLFEGSTALAETVGSKQAAEQLLYLADFVERG